MATQRRRYSDTHRKVGPSNGASKCGAPCVAEEHGAAATAHCPAPLSRRGAARSARTKSTNAGL